MYELMAMSANCEAELDLSLSLLRPRGCEIGSHSDGWGVAFYEGNAARIFKEPKPVSRSTIFSALRGREFASPTVLAHIRKANSSAVRQQFSDTHPFERELAGRSWVFAHNGQLTEIEEQPLVAFHPIGKTSSEHAFCLLLDTVRDFVSDDGLIHDVELTLDRLSKKVSAINDHGEFNFVLSNGQYLFVHTHTYVHALERRCQVGQTDQSVLLIATYPLSEAEAWTCLSPNSLSAFRDGRLIAEQPTASAATSEAWQRRRCEAETVARFLQEGEASWAKLRAGHDEGMYYESG